MLYCGIPGMLYCTVPYHTIPSHTLRYRKPALEAAASVHPAHAEAPQAVHGSIYIDPKAMYGNPLPL